MYCIIISCFSFISFSIYFVAVYLLFEINFLTKKKDATLQDIFAVWAGVRKVPSGDNRSIFYRACAKFVTRFASKINHQVCRQMARVSRELKNCNNSDLLRKTHAML